MPLPICASSAAYFHGVVLIVGGQRADRRILKTVYALRPPRLPLMKDREELGQWTLLSGELPCFAWANCICCVGDELSTSGE